MASFSGLFGGGGGFEIIQRDIFTASGTWTKGGTVLDTDTVIVDLWGGGGGGRTASTASTANTGAGGGGHNRILLLSSILTATESVVVGAGGVGFTGSSGLGTSGGDSSFGNYGIAGGGSPSLRGGGNGGGTGFGYKSAGYGSTPGPIAGDKWSGGTSASNGLREFCDAHHGGGGGTTVNDRGGFSMWGGAGSQGPFTSNLLAASISLYGGNSGAMGYSTTLATDGVAPGGAGGCGQNTVARDGGRGEARVYVIRGSIPDYEFVFEAV
tara:strand:+ start:124 stop:927 length:804 start_codon:yes stop_codon:yes gene_type:complete